MKYDESQIILLKKVSDYINDVEKKGIDSSSSSLCYFPTWTNDPGLLKLKLWIYGYKNIFSFIKIFIRNLLSVAKYSKFSIIFSHKPHNYKKIILSFSTKNSFQNDGSFTDRLLNINSKDYQKILWFLVSSDNYIPTNLDKNICVLIRQKDTLFNYFFFFIKTILKNLFLFKFNIIKFMHQILCDSIYAKIVSYNFINLLKKNNISLIFMPYEGQPFNNYVIKETKNFDKEIKIVGYHSAIPPLPTNMIYREGAPDKLIISGYDQYFYLSHFLNWGKDKLEILPSLRYKHSKKIINSNMVYLPYVIFDINKVLILFEKLISNNNLRLKYYFDQKNHPLCTDSPIHKKLILIIEKIYKKYEIDKSMKSKNTSIFIGPTSAVIESLVRGEDVYHICSDPVFEAYSSRVWPNLFVKEIQDGILHYKLLDENKTIILGNDDKLFDNNYINEY